MKRVCPSEETDTARRLPTYGLRDSDIDRIQAWRNEKGTPIPANAQRAIAGNSIVVDVLYHIFRKLFVDTRCEKGEQIYLPL